MDESGYFNDMNIRGMGKTTNTTLFGSGGNGGCTITGSVIGGCSPGTVEHSQSYYPGEKPFVLDYYGTQMQEDELLELFSIELRYTLQGGIVLRSLSGHVHIDINHSYTVNPVAVGTPGTINGYYNAVEQPNLVALVGSDSVERIMGAFGQVQWQMTNQLQWQLGLRENWDNNFSFNSPQPCPGVGTVMTTRTSAAPAST